MATLTEIWQDDTLGRRHDADTVYRFLMAQIAARRLRGAAASYVLNIDASWGHGKSYFLDRFASQLELSDHIVARVDAWENDLTNEPMIAVMSAIEDALRPHFGVGTQVGQKWTRVVKSSGPLAVSLVKGVATSLLKKHTDTFLDDVGEMWRAGSPDVPASNASEETPIGEGVAAVVEKLGDDFASRLIEAHKQQLNSIKAFRQNLSSMAAAIRASRNSDSLVFVLVDELDRCRPSHAIHLLESIKHLFNTDGIVFVVATNTDQLSASVKAVYGNDFNAKTYLLRFFDRTYRFRDAEPKMFVHHLFAMHRIDAPTLSRNHVDSIDLTTAYFAALGMSLRDIEQCFEIFATVYSLWDGKMPLQLALIWPMISMYHAGRLSEFDFLRGKPSPSNMETIFPADRVLFTAGEYDATHGRTVQVSATIREITRAYLHGNSMALPELTNNSTSISEQVATDYFSTEFDQIHSNQYNRDDPPVSVTRHYGDLVKLAVQFKSAGAEAGPA